MRAAAYVRVSDEAQSTDLQRDEIASAAGAKGDEVVGWYEEKASAKTTARAALTALRADVRAGKWRTIYVWKLDRLCRSGIRDAFTLVDEFREAGCKVISLRDPFDLAGPAGDLLLAVFAWAAQVEREFIAARVKAGMEAAKRRGKHVGRPRRLVDLGRARQLLGEGQSQRQVARALRLPPRTLIRALAGYGGPAGAVSAPGGGNPTASSRGGAKGRSARCAGVPRNYEVSETAPLVAQKD